MNYKKGLTYLIVLIVGMMMIFSSSIFAMGHNTVVWTGFPQGLNSIDCTDSPAEGQIHWVLTGNNRNITFAEIVLGGTGSGEFEAVKSTYGGGSLQFYTPYFELEGLTAFVRFQGTAARSAQLVISDYCPGEVENLLVEKTAVTSFEREHFWDIDKMVETENEEFLNGFPKIWLYMNGEGDETATWTVDVSYEGYEDSKFNVSGEVTIENIGNVDAVITEVEDILGGVPIIVDFGVEFPYTLEVGEILIGTYDEDVESKIEGFNEVTVTTERDEYFADAEIIWGDPEEEINKTVNIKDISDLFGEVDLGTATAPNNAQFTYSKDFAYIDYFNEYGNQGPFSFIYDNTAEIVETGQEAEARLKVNVQRRIFRGETAWAANGTVPGELPYNPDDQGNWATYVEFDGAEKTTTLFAGQTINVGTVNFKVEDSEYVMITINLSGNWGFASGEYLKVQDYDMAPSGNPSPGQFDHKVSSGNQIVVPLNNFYGVHVDVGIWMPDPNFGP